VERGGPHQSRKTTGRQMRVSRCKNKVVIHISCPTGRAVTVGSRTLRHQNGCVITGPRMRARPRRIRLHQDRFPVSRNQKPSYRYEIFVEILAKIGNGSVYNRARSGRSRGPVKTDRFCSLIRFAVYWIRLRELEIVFVLCLAT
jgi:hypothetical protein